MFEVLNSLQLNLNKPFIFQIEINEKIKKFYIRKSYKRSIR